MGPLPSGSGEIVFVANAKVFLLTLSVNASSYRIWLRLLLPSHAFLGFPNWLYWVCDSMKVLPTTDQFLEVVTNPRSVVDEGAVQPGTLVALSLTRYACSS